MTSNELLEFTHLFFEKAENILKSKNSDYSGNNNDAFQNFKAVENNYHTKTEIGFIVRMSDKMSRVASFIANGSLMVKDESVTDTLIDLANYSCLLAAYIKSKKNDNEHLQISGHLSLKLQPFDRSGEPMERGVAGHDCSGAHGIPGNCCGVDFPPKD